jgi:hypothetical protein
MILILPGDLGARARGFPVPVIFAPANCGSVAYFGFVAVVRPAG